MSEIRFVGTGETRGYPHLVYKKPEYSSSENDDRYYRPYLQPKTLHFKTLSMPRLLG